MLHRCFMYEYMQKRLRETQKIPVKSRSTVQQRKKNNKNENERKQSELQTFDEAQSEEGINKNLKWK